MLSLHLPRPVYLKHCVCFIGDVVFDPNFDFAMVASQESMDCICNKLQLGVSYDGIEWSRELILKKEWRLAK